jgi:hypothetical protein
MRLTQRKNKTGMRQCLIPSRQREEKEEKYKRRRVRFLLVLNRKITIYEDPTVGSSIRFRKRDPCTCIHVLTDCFKVKH